MEFILSSWHNITGSTETYQDLCIGCVHVKDVAMAHILLYENKYATGRHLCCKDISHFSDIASKVSELYPEYNVAKYVILNLFLSACSCFEILYMDLVIVTSFYTVNTFESQEVISLWELHI